jgi:isopenicillin N synthase-like dioxygenase
MKHLSSLTGFFTQLHQVLDLLLSSLSSSLALPSDSLAKLHRPVVPSTDILRLLHYYPQPASETGVPQAPHTDLGSLTLLFTKVPGLQILPSNSTEWEFVEPKPHCAVVNIGDGRCFRIPKSFFFAYSTMAYTHSLIPRMTS